MPVLYARYNSTRCCVRNELLAYSSFQDIESNDCLPTQVIRKYFSNQIADASRNANQ